MADEKVRVMSVDDHPLLREGIAAVINSAADMVMVAQAATGGDAVRGPSATMSPTSRSWTFDCRT